MKGILPALRGATRLGARVPRECLSRSLNPPTREIGYALSMAPGKPPEPAEIGLCATCAHVRRIESDKGSVFFLCQLALTDGRFRKYPRLPVLRCDGHVPAKV